MQVNPAPSVGPDRLGVVGYVLAAVLRELHTGEPVRVLDCGGGSGSFAVPLAQAGAAVTVVDISADALATLRRRATDAGVSELVTGVQGDVEDLDAAVAPELLFDLVLAHDILDEIDAPAGSPAAPAVESAARSFRQVAQRVAPGGRLSVLVANPAAAVLSRALAGDLSGALSELRAVQARVRLGPAGVEQLCREAGFLIDQVAGVGVFADLVPGTAVDTPGGREALAELEAAAATRAPFADIATRIHVLARRPARH